MRRKKIIYQRNYLLLKSNNEFINKLLFSNVMDNKKYLSDIIEKIRVESREQINQLEGLQNNYVSIMGEKDHGIEQKIQDISVQNQERAISIVDNEVTKLRAEKEKMQIKYDGLQKEYQKIMGLDDPRISKKANQETEQFDNCITHLNVYKNELLQKTLPVEPVKDQSIDSVMIEEPIDDEPVYELSPADKIKSRIRELEAERNARIASIVKVGVSFESEFKNQMEITNIQRASAAIGESYDPKISEQYEELKRIEMATVIPQGEKSSDTSL